MWGLWVHEAITGDEIDQVWPTENSSWSMNLAGAGECSFAFRIDDPETGMKLQDVERLFAGADRHLCLRWGPAAVGAWKVEDWDYDQDTETVTVTGAELRVEAKWRMTYGMANYGDGTLVVSGRSASGAVRAILQRFQYWDSRWVYPIDLPADGPGALSFTWDYWKKFTIDDLLQQVEQLGYEIVFRPYITAAGKLRYQVLVAAAVSVGMKYFHLQAADSPLSGVGYRRSYSEQITGGQGLGSGTGQDQQTAFVSTGSPLRVIRDAKRTFPDLEGAVLQSATTAWGIAAGVPITQWRVKTFTASDEHPASLAAVASAWSLDSSGHRIFPDGRHHVRVISCNGTMSTQITVEVQGA